MRDYNTKKALKIMQEALNLAMSDPIPVIIDQAPRRLDLFNQVIIYRITVYRNVLDGFEVYCN